MTAPRLDISAFFPAYNEAANLESLTRRTAETLQRLARQWEIIIVDDGSRDTTPEVANRLVQALPGVKYLRHAQNQGYGGAVRTGLKTAQYDWVFFTDGDGQFDPTELERLVPLTTEADFIAGFRIKRRDHFLRKLNAWAWGTLVRTLFGLSVRDIDCAFKLFQRRVIDAAPLEASGAMISTELLARAKKLGYRFRQVGVNHYPRQAGKQTGANPKVIWRAFQELFQLYARLK